MCEAKLVAKLGLKREERGKGGMKTRPWEEGQLDFSKDPIFTCLGNFCFNCPTTTNLDKFFLNIVKVIGFCVKNLFIPQNFTLMLPRL